MHSDIRRSDEVHEGEAGEAGAGGAAPAAMRKRGGGEGVEDGLAIGFVICDSRYPSS